MWNCLARNTRARWFKARAIDAGLAVLAATAGLSAQTLDTLAHNYHERPSAANRAAVLSYANAHAKDTSGALALLVLGVLPMIASILSRKIAC